MIYNPVIMIIIAYMVFVHDNLFKGSYIFVEFTKGIFKSAPYLETFSGTFGELKKMVLKPLGISTLYIETSWCKSILFCPMVLC